MQRGCSNSQPALNRLAVVILGDIIQKGSRLVPCEYNGPLSMAFLLHIMRDIQLMSCSPLAGRRREAGYKSEEIRGDGDIRIFERAPVIKHNSSGRLVGRRSSSDACTDVALDGTSLTRNKPRIRCKTPFTVGQVRREGTSQSFLVDIQGGT